MPVFAAVDIGSNSVRLSIAEFRRGKVTSLHEDREVTRLGEGVFRDGRLDPQAMAHTMKVLRRFQRSVQSYAVDRIRVVATSALRDSRNSRIFSEWVKSGTGWRLEVISGLEEGRLIHLGVMSQLRKRLRKVLLMDVGGGSCEITLSEGGHIREIVTLPLGAVRLTQEFIHHDPPKADELRRLHEFIAEQVAQIPRQILRAKAGVAIVTSGTGAALSGAAQAMKLAKQEVSLAATVKLAHQLSRMKYRQRAEVKGINAKRAEIVIAGAVVFAQVLAKCGVRGFRYSSLGLRDGILAQMAAEYDSRSLSHRQIESDRQDVLLSTGRRYRVDLKHAEHVSRLATMIFDQTKSVHSLPRDYREWILAAAMLYEAGAYVNPVGQHRHTYYLVSHSELFGFSPSQRQIIATIARFQGSSKPQFQDRLIKALPAQVRSDVIKATAILRVAKALDQGRRRAVRSIRAHVRGGQVACLAESSGADLEIWAVAKEAPYFREVFGRELTFKVA